MVDNYTEFAQKKKLEKRIRQETKATSRVLSKILTFFFSLTFVVALLLGSAIIFHNIYFQSFFVNGQSMYPTLNGNATYSDGTLIGERQIRPDDGNIVEYGIMDTHQVAIKGIRRFDIIITAYSSGDLKDKIKRVIAMPGDTFYFVSTSPGEATNGDLYIIPDGETDGVLIPQTFGDEDILRAKDYSGAYVPKESNPLTLEDNEYYVMGDNRPDSSDSSSAGPILYEYIKGVAIAIEGTCTLVCSNGECRAEQVNFHWPRSLRWQDA